MEDWSNKFNEAKNAYMKLIENVIESKTLDGLYSVKNDIYSKLRDYVEQHTAYDISEKMKEIQNIINNIINYNMKIKERKRVLAETNYSAIIDKYVCAYDYENDGNEKINCDIKSSLEDLINKLDDIKEYFFDIEYEHFASSAVFKELHLASISLALILEIEGLADGILASYESKEKYILMKNIRDMAPILELVNELKYNLLYVDCFCEYDSWMGLLTDLYSSIEVILETKISYEIDESDYYYESEIEELREKKTIGDIIIPLRNMIYI